MPRKDDRRILRTRKLLRESMVQLIMERGYDDISIQDVTDKANLGRATFYLHYHEKDDLLADVMRQQFDEFTYIAPSTIPPKAKAVELKRIQQLFDFAESRYDLFRIMMIGKGSMVASRYLHQAVRDGYRRDIDRIQEACGIVPAISRDFIENYYAGSLISLIFWWLDNEMPYKSSEMAEMYMKVSTHIVMSVIPGAEEPLVPLYVSQSQPQKTQASEKATTKKPAQGKSSPTPKPKSADKTTPVEKQPQPAKPDPEVKTE